MGSGKIWRGRAPHRGAVCAVGAGARCPHRLLLRTCCPPCPPGAGKGCGSLLGSIRSVGPEGHLLPVADPIRKLKRREPEKIIIPSRSELFFLALGCECSAASVSWPLGNPLHWGSSFGDRRGVPSALQARPDMTSHRSPPAARSGVSQQHRSVRAGGHEGKARFGCKNPFGHRSAVRGRFCEDGCGVLHDGKCRVPPFYLSSGPWDWDRGLLPLTSWFGADGLVPMDCTLVPPGWNKIVIINVIITIAHLVL